MFVVSNDRKIRISMYSSIIYTNNTLSNDTLSKQKFFRRIRLAKMSHQARIIKSGPCKFALTSGHVCTHTAILSGSTTPRRGVNDISFFFLADW